MAICKIGGLLLRHFSIVFNGTTATSDVVTIRCGRRWWGGGTFRLAPGRHFPMSGPSWALSGTDVQAPWHGVLETVWLHCDEAQQVECQRGWKGCPLVQDAGINGKSLEQDIKPRCNPYF